MDEEIKLRIVVERPPSGIDYGLQKGRGNPYETVQTQRSGKKDLVFEFPVTINARTNSMTGPYVQGPAGAKFVYIDIGTYAGQQNTPWRRRMKVPLTGITSDAIKSATKSSAVLEARVPGTGKNGEPNCATIQPVAGWKVKR